MINPACTFQKLLKKAYYNRLASYLHIFKILSSNQYGFRKGYSTSYALIDLYDKISCSPHNREVVIGDFCDRFGLHYLRIGGTSAAANNNLPERIIKKHGGWKTDSMKDLHCRENLQQLLSVLLHLGS